MRTALGSWADEMEDMPVPCTFFRLSLKYLVLTYLAAAGMPEFPYTPEKAAYCSSRLIVF